MMFAEMYTRDKGEPLPPGFWIGVILVLLLFYLLHGR